MSTRPYKFLVVPAEARRYDYLLAEGLASALRQAGHEAAVPLGPVAGPRLPALCRDHGFDVVFRVNRGRPAVDLPKGTRHISWFQDFHYDTDAQELGDVKSDDIVYFLGSPDVLGMRRSLPCKIGSLFTGVSPSVKLEPPLREPMWDFTLCGYIPPPRGMEYQRRTEALLEQAMRTSYRLPYRMLRRLLKRPGNFPYLRATPGMIIDCETAVEALYRPLSGYLDVQAVAKAIQGVIDSHYPGWLQRLAGASNLPDIMDGMDFGCYYSTHYPRFLDRILLIRMATVVSDRIALYGLGWEDHTEFKPFHRGTLETTYGLYRAYRSAGLNLGNNTHGLGLHSRTLECMHAGGVIMMHTSPHDEKEGGMLRHFEPGVHYVSYTRDTFQEQALRWLKDDDGRQRMAEQARETVAREHLWRHRAEQILRDLD